MGQLLPNAREARAWQAHAAHLDQASGGDCGFTCCALPNGRFGGDGISRHVASMGMDSETRGSDDSRPLMCFFCFFFGPLSWVHRGTALTFVALAR